MIEKIQAARKAGYSDTEIADFLGGPKAVAARNSGYSDAEIIGFYSGEQSAPGAQRNGLANLGLGVARGLKNTVDAGAAALSSASDAIGLTSGEGDRVRKMNADGRAEFARDTRGSTAAQIGEVAGEIPGLIVAGGVPGAVIKAAGVAAQAPKIAAAGEILLAQGARGTLGQRVGAGAVAGAASSPVLEAGRGQEVTAEGAVGGAAVGGAVPAALAGVGRLIQGAKVKTQAQSSAQPPVAAGVESPPVTQPISAAEAAADPKKAQALQASGGVSAGAEERLADYRALGIENPLGPMITRDPLDWGKMRELAKMDEYMPSIAATYDQIEQVLEGRLKSMTTGSVTPTQSSKAVVDALQGIDQNLKREASDMYNVTREHPDMKRGVNLEPVMRIIDDNKFQWQDATPFVAAKRWINANKIDLANGRLAPMQIEKVEEFRKAMNAVYDPTNPVKARAAKQIIEAIDDAVFKTSGDDVFRSAREAHKLRKMTVDDQGIIDDLLSMSSRTDRKVALEDVWSRAMRDVEGLKQLKNTLNVHGRGEVFDEIKGQTMRHLHSKAFNNQDQFQFNAFQNALDKLGDEKLKVVFDKSELDTLKRIARVGKYTRSDVRNSAVNHSNTSSQLLNALTRAAGTTGVLGGLATPISWAASGMAKARENAVNTALMEAMLKGNLYTSGQAQAHSAAARQRSRDALAAALQKVPASAAISPANQALEGRR
jgi:hypothetical protein